MTGHADVFTTSDQKAYEPPPSLTQPELPFKGASEVEPANSDKNGCTCPEHGWSADCRFASHRWYATRDSSATDEAVARCESGVGGERSRSEVRIPRVRAAQPDTAGGPLGQRGDSAPGRARPVEAARLTYRERRERRAERLRGWAEKREQSAGAVLASHEVYRGDHAFNFQPGHIPQRERVIRQADRAFESLHKAESMSSRADEIERQAEHAIYSDDPDAVERLRERIAELEAKRAKIKAYNASCRKGSPDTSLLTEREQAALLSTARAVPYAMGKGGGFPSYELTNLSANINRQKKRLAAFERGAA